MKYTEERVCMYCNQRIDGRVEPVQSVDEWMDEDLVVTFWYHLRCQREEYEKQHGRSAWGHRVESLWGGF